MTRRRGTAGLALLCAFVFSAFVSQSAMAQVGTASVNTTAFTCVEVAEGGHFEDAHCDIPHPTKEGKFTHQAIANDTTTELDISQEGSSKFNFVFAGVTTEFTCNKVKSVAEKSFLHNVESSGKHTVTGTVQVNFTECTVVKPLKCVVKEPIVFTSSFQGVEGLNPSTENEMGTEFVGKGENKNFAELFFENKGAEKCALLNGGKPYVTGGSMIARGVGAEVNPCEEGAIEKQSGATWKFDPGPEANNMQTLVSSPLKPVSFASVLTAKMAGGGNPTTFTTVT